jgi:hypothetical protein
MRRLSVLLIVSCFHPLHFLSAEVYVDQRNLHIRLASDYVLNSDLWVYILTEYQPCFSTVETVEKE